MSQPPTVPPLIVNVKVEDVVAENAGGSSLELSSAVRNEYEQLNIALKSVRMVSKVQLQRLLEAVNQSSEDIIEGVHVVLCDTPYSTRRIAVLPNSEHDRLSLQDMSHFVEVPSPLVT